MKKALMIIAIVAFVAIASSMIYYFVFFRESSRTKEEIIKFDTEYNKIIDNLNKENELLAIKYQKITNTNINFIRNDMQSMFNSTIKDLKKLYVPKPLDDFYDKNIEYYSNLYDSVSINSKIDMGELPQLDIEINRIKREVYRKYDLEYLLKN